MKVQDILEAEKEAKRFLSKLRDLKESQMNYRGYTEHGLTTGNKESGALKRSSMDLTRILAKLRNNTY
jgi:hypothetical protein